MKVWIDGREHPELPSSATALEIMEAVKADAARSGHVVTGLRVDGVEMDEEAFLGLSGGLAAHFTLAPVRLLVRESLEEALAYIPRLRRGIEDIAGHFEQGETSRARSQLSEAMDGLDWTLKIYERCTALTAELIPEAEEHAIREGLLNALNRLIGLMGEKRYPEMALALRQELLPNIEALAANLGRLAQSRATPQ
ncbi:hypothetical protein [Fretibacterium sp. OH1220_COT-178]|uniref:hypothetical protein n=1 Tax=Fretibacterium sp. OH1220_COT-178 TaxID=2491047 RepID=UPI000F5DEF01|nr:hypothetical protein [Fretibacterium sp. OH1220_COT-178]RRD65240.1 hypothetical protein EII26_03980 [Fretibacterium sp. OH1220_COT-178]